MPDLSLPLHRNERRVPVTMPAVNGHGRLVIGTAIVHKDGYISMEIINEEARAILCGPENLGDLSIGVDPAVARSDFKHVARYRSKSKGFDAIRYTGGEQNCREIINWVLSKGLKAAYAPALEPWQNDEGTEGHPGQPEMLTVALNDHRIVYVMLGDWICFDQEGFHREGLFIESGTTFYERYERYE